MSAAPWEPDQADPDTADDVHELLDALPEHQRTAAAMLLDLPDDYPIPLAGRPDQHIPAGRLFVAICTEQITPERVWRHLLTLGMTRPGIDGAP